jgi:hypothetical protein
MPTTTRAWTPAADPDHPDAVAALLDELRK